MAIAANRRIMVPKSSGNFKVCFAPLHQLCGIV